MKLSKKELAELIVNIKSTGGDASQLEGLMNEIEAEEKTKKDNTNVVTREMVNWTPQHEDFRKKVQLLIEAQRLEIHPRLRPRLSAWIDAAINRDFKCVMDRVRGCPCEEPTKWGCPLLRKVPPE